VLGDLKRRGLKRPEFVIVDGAPGLDKAIATVWDGVPAQRCTVHKNRNLLAHSPERLHDEITADYNVMIYTTTPEEIALAARPASANGGSNMVPLPTAWRKQVCSLRAHATKPVVQSTHDQYNRALARGVQAGGSKPKPFCRRPTPLR
jgi:transposase-like protein